MELRLQFPQCVFKILLRGSLLRDNPLIIGLLILGFRKDVALRFFGRVERTLLGRESCLLFEQLCSLCLRSRLCVRERLLVRRKLHNGRLHRVLDRGDGIHILPRIGNRAGR